MPIARLNAPGVADISPVTNALGALGQERRFKEQLAQEQEMVSQALVDDEALARLSTVNPQAAAMVGQIISRQDSQEAARVQAHTQRVAREASFLQKLNGEQQDRQIRRLAQEAVTRGDDPASYLELLEMEPADREIELLRDITQATEISKLLGGDKGFTLDEGSKRFDAQGNLIAENKAPKDGFKARELAVKEGNLELNRQKFAAEQAKAGMPDDDKSFNKAMKLQDRFTKETADFVKQSDAFGRIQASAEDPSAAGDLSLIFNFMKVLDPGSTVREGEFANAENAGGVPQRVRSIYGKLINGERLSPTQRGDFVARSKKLFKAAETAHTTREKKFRKLAGTAKVNPDLVVFDRRTVGTGDGETFTSPDGVSFEVR